MIDDLKSHETICLTDIKLCENSDSWSQNYVILTCTMSINFNVLNKGLMFDVAIIFWTNP